MDNTLTDFLNKKKAESTFLSIVNGETVKVKELKSIKSLVKLGYDNKEKEVLRLACLVETTEGERVKDFDNGTQRFAQELVEKGIDIGSSFDLTREGEQAKTRYIISNVKGKVTNVASPVNPATAGTQGTASVQAGA